MEKAADKRRKAELEQACRRTIEERIKANETGIKRRMRRRAIKGEQRQSRGRRKEKKNEGAEKELTNEEKNTKIKETVEKSRRKSKG